jgi:hypothetical protein
MAQLETRNRANMIVSLILIGLGALILLGQVLRIGALWPLFIIVPGLMFFVGMAFGGKAAGPLAIPGSIVTMVGLILLVQSWLQHFESWIYAWTLIPAAVGIGLVIHGKWSGDDRSIRTGRRVMTIALIVFLVVGAFFELIVHLSKAPLGGYLWPLLMIGVGVYLLMRRGGQHARVLDAPARRMEAAPTQPSSPTRPASKPPAKAATPPSAPQFEPLDMTRGKKGARSKPKDSTPQV